MLSQRRVTFEKENAVFTYVEDKCYFFVLTVGDYSNKKGD